MLTRRKQTGRAYLDSVNNVAHVGHCHPRIAKAGAAHMTLLNTNTRYLSELPLKLAERLRASLPSSLSVCYFVCSGSEANDLALRIAAAHTKRSGILVLDGTYGGVSFKEEDMNAKRKFISFFLPSMQLHIMGIQPH